MPQVCLHFITSHFPEVIRTEGFQALSRELLDQVHFAMANRHYPDKEAKLEKEVQQPATGAGRRAEVPNLRMRQLSLGSAGSMAGTPERTRRSEHVLMSSPTSDGEHT